MDEERDRLKDTARRARELFEASVDSLDEETRARLSRARFEAVAATGRRARPARWLGWVPVVAVASTAVVAVLLWRSPEPSPTATTAEGETSLEAVEILAAGEDLDLVENDLEFYEWLEAMRFEDTGTTG